MEEQERQEPTSTYRPLSSWTIGRGVFNGLEIGMYEVTDPDGTTHIEEEVQAAWNTPVTVELADQQQSVDPPVDHPQAS